MSGINFKCAKEGCYDSAAPNRAVCPKHFVIDFIVTVFVGVGIVGFIIGLAKGICG